MTIGTKIIKSSLREIQVDTLNSPATAEDIEDSVITLNSMLQIWKSKGIDIGFTPLKASGDELSEPGDATNAIIFNLAILRAAAYEDGQAVVTQTLKDNARMTFEDLIGVGYRKFTVPSLVPSSTLPVGQGNVNRFGRRRNFFGRNRPLGD